LQRCGLTAEKLPAFPLLHLGRAHTEKSIALLTRPGCGGARGGGREPFGPGALCLQSPNAGRPAQL